MTVIFVGHFAPDAHSVAVASSVPGNEVQRQIVRELRSRCGDQEVEVVAMRPVPVWPHGPIFVGRNHEPSIQFVPYLNLPLMKHLIFSIFVFFRARKKGVRCIVQYNSYLFENISILIGSRLSGYKSAIYIQDVNIFSGTKGIRSWIRSAFERMSLYVARGFDIILPVSQAIVDDFGFEKEKSVIFRGAPTRVALDGLRVHGKGLKEIAVFAGALEPYNGIQVLIEKWRELDVPWELHVFGRGSLVSLVEDSGKEAASRVVYHGFLPPEEVFLWQSQAMWNFCLRYSSGLNQEYFFPSKFFNSLCLDGSLIVNEFNNIPPELLEFIELVDDDLGNLKEVLDRARYLTRSSAVERKLEVLRSGFTWTASVDMILGKIN